MRARLVVTLLFLVVAGPSTPLYGQKSAPAEKPAVIFEKVRIYDGKGDRLTEMSSVLVVGNTIKQISRGAIDTTNLAVTRVDGGGRTLMPGLIDAHWHTMLIRLTPEQLLANDIGYTTLLGAAEAKSTILRGFTTVRDLGGPSFSLKKAIDEGVVIGPRIFPSGAMISVTSGHGDFRRGHEVPRILGGPLTRMEQLGGSLIADSPDEVRTRVREQFLQGASQVKLTAGGGVASPHSPLDVSTFTEAELRAAVEAARNWGTYVVAHAYTPAAIKRALAAGVKNIEHGHLMDEEAAKQMAAKGAWLGLQPFLDDEDAIPFPKGSTQAAKQKEIFDGTDRAYAMAKKYGVKTAFGTDVLFSKPLADRQGAILAKLTRWYTIPELLRMATSGNAQLLKLSGERNPYPGQLGVVEKGAYADLLLVEGNPLKSVKWLEEPARSLRVIMKDGTIVKNSLGDEDDKPKRLGKRESRPQPGG